jgi:hypothetical protein
LCAASGDTYKDLKGPLLAQVGIARQTRVTPSVCTTAMSSRTTSSGSLLSSSLLTNLYGPHRPIAAIRRYIPIFRGALELAFCLVVIERVAFRVTQHVPTCPLHGNNDRSYERHAGRALGEGYAGANV